MDMQSIAHFSEREHHWYWQSSCFGTTLRKGENTLEREDFRAFLLEAGIHEIHFREMILDFINTNAKFLEEIGPL